MIVPAMNENEILIEMIKEYQVCTSHIEKVQNKYRRAVIKSSKFPVNFKPIEFTSKRNNKFLIFLSAYNKRDSTNLFRTIVCYYNTNMGMHGIMLMPRPEGNGLLFSITIYTPHFFARYRERFLHQDISTLETMKIFFKNNPTYSGQVNDDGDIQASCNDGFVFIKILSESYFIAKTFVGRDMLFKNQQEFDTVHLDDIHELNKKKNLKVYDYMFGEAG